VLGGPLEQIDVKVIEPLPGAARPANAPFERSHRIDAEEFYRLLDGVIIDDTKIFNNKLQEWEDYYNYHRPHGGLGGQTPYERIKQKTQQQTPA